MLGQGHRGRMYGPGQEFPGRSKEGAMADPADPEHKTTASAGRLPRRRTGAPREHPQEETRGPLAKMRLPRREAKRRGADAEAEVEKGERDVERLLAKRTGANERLLAKRM